MSKENSSFKRVAGFTVIELLIAVFLAGLVTSSAMALYLTQRKQLFVQEEVTDMQSSLRAAVGELTTKVRMVGYKLPEGLPSVIARNTNPDTIKILTNADYLEDIQIEHSMPQPSSELRCDGHDLTGIVDGDTLYIFDPYINSGEYFTVTQVQYASSNIQHNTTPLSRRYPQGSKILKIQSTTYYIDQTDPNHPNLMYQYQASPSEIYAENITDLNLQYVMSDGSIADVPMLTNMIREVVISVTARTNKADNEFEAPYRDRNLTTRVKVRNLGAN
jgi:type II secretory pathway pseudopilin PulG